MFRIDLGIKLHDFSHVLFIISSRINNFTNPCFFVFIIHIRQCNRYASTGGNMIKTCFPLFLLCTRTLWRHKHHQFRMGLKQITHQLNHTWTFLTILLGTAINPDSAHSTHKRSKRQFHIAVFNGNTHMNTQSFQC
ncbi:hypothetical protein D3C75_1077360 [compost metagenome]